MSVSPDKCVLYGIEHLFGLDRVKSNPHWETYGIIYLNAKMACRLNPLAVLFRVIR